MDNSLNTAGKSVYVIGIISSFMFIAYVLVTISIFAAVGEGYPKTAIECFNIIQENRFIALLCLDIVSVVVMPFYYALFFVIYWVLKDNNEFYAKAAFLLTFAGITLFISDINILSILHLADKYSASGSVEYRHQLLSACETLLAGDMWITASAKIRGIMIESGAVIFSVIMLRTQVFTKSVGIVGLLAHGFDLSSETVSIFIPAAKDIFTMIGGPLYFIWFILLAVDFIRLLRKEPSA